MTMAHESPTNMQTTKQIQGRRETTGEGFAHASTDQLLIFDRIERRLNRAGLLR